MSGAKNCPETPRQKMIGMMYLVLTAMLALNVSSEILNGFTMVDNSLHKTIESSELRNKSLYADFQDLFDKNPAKVREWLEKAKTVKKKSDDLYKFIENFKVQIVRLADKKEANDSAYVKQINAKDNMDKAAQYGIAERHGKELKKQIEEYRSFLVDLSANNPSKQKMYQSIFATGKTKDGKQWDEALFEGMPLSAVITILTKYQSDIRSSEAEIIQYLKSQTDALDFRVNKITAVVVPNTPYVLRGEKYSAQIVLAAVDSTKKPDYYVNGQQVRNGLYEVMANKLGIISYSGQIKLQGNDGNVMVRPFKSSYTVGEPAATLSNEDLNVVYRGIDNKFSISVPGVASEDVTIRVIGGSYRKEGGKFLIQPSRNEDINIEVWAKVDGKQKKMGGGAYRVKLLPDPKAFIQPNDAGAKPIRGGFMSPSALRSSSLIASYGKDELIKAKFRVISFTMLAKGFSPVQVGGSRLNAAFLDKLIKGDILMINNIKAEGPDLIPRDLGSIAIQL
ncbi:MAG: gliding motility protein GldM [Bacteroidota bacterium]|nr:gliding motility protein GldM [Bacteroidota bacterium]